MQLFESNFLKKQSEYQFTEQTIQRRQGSFRWNQHCAYKADKAGIVYKNKQIIYRA